MYGMGSRSLFGQFRTLFGSGTLSGLGEGALLERFLAQKDETAFEEILARHGPMVLGICRRWLDDPHDVDDAFQAVFLILIRKAATLRDRNSLSNWLYGVSLRVAQRARASAARRRSRERQDPEGLSMAQATGARPDEREIPVIIDEEIRRLPAKQQAAVVLCLVQGKTHEAAALELRCPLGTVKSRVAGGRATLSRRLTRRGLAPSIVIGSRPPLEIGIASEVPNELLGRTIKAALQYATVHSMRGAAVTASVCSLAEGVLNTMLIARMKSIAVAVAALGVLACAATAFVLARQEAPPGREATGPPVNVAIKAESPLKLDLYGDPLPSGASMRLGTIRHRQDAQIYRTAFTPDARLLVTDGDDSQLRVWNAQDGTLSHRVKVPIEALSDFALSSDGKIVATTGVNLVPGKGIVREVVFSELSTGRELSRGSWVKDGTIEKLALCPDRRLLVTGSADGRLRFVNTSNGVESGTILFDKESVQRISLSRAGDRVAVATGIDGGPKPGRIRVFDITNLNELRALAKLDVDHDALAFSPDGNIVAITQTLALIFWDITSGQQSRHDNAYIEHMEFSPDGTRLIGIRYTGDIFVFWNPIARRYIGSMATASLVTGSLSLSPDNRTIAASGGPHVLHRWDMGTGREHSPATDAHQDRVTGATFTADGKVLITSSNDNTVRLWNVATGRQQKSLKHPFDVGPVSLLSDNRSLIVGARYKSFCYLWDIAKDEEPAILDDPDSQRTHTLAVTRSDEDHSILTFTDDGTLRRWNLETRRVQEKASFPFLLESIIDDAKLKRIKDTLIAAMLLKGGRLLATTGIFSGLRVVDVETRKEVGHFPAAELVIVSPDEKTLAVTFHGDKQTLRRFGYDPREDKLFNKGGTIILLDNKTFAEKLRIVVPGSEVWAMAISPDGKTLAATTGWETGQIRLYDVATGREIRTINTSAIRKSALAFSPDGAKIACGMADTSVVLWDVPARP